MSYEPSLQKLKQKFPLLCLSQVLLLKVASQCIDEKMGLKIIENFDGNFTLNPDAKAELFALLNHETFIEQISLQLEAVKLEFTGLLFQPVPYSQKTPKGMPAEFEAYHNSDDYIIINVPPNFMFKAKIFKPSRLCAVYKKAN